MWIVLARMDFNCATIVDDFIQISFWYVDSLFEYIINIIYQSLLWKMIIYPLKIGKITQILKKNVCVVIFFKMTKVGSYT